MLRSDQEEDYGLPAVSEQVGTVYEHCVRALEHGYKLGPHSLPLMGAGDWNDGMNREPFRTRSVRVDTGARHRYLESALGVGDRGGVGRLPNAGAVQIEKDRLAGETWFARVLNAVSIVVVKDDAADHSVALSRHLA